MGVVGPRRVAAHRFARDPWLLNRRVDEVVEAVSNGEQASSHVLSSVALLSSR
jgi:hypothetical protein